MSDDDSPLCNSMMDAEDSPTQSVNSSSMSCCDLESINEGSYDPASKLSLIFIMHTSDQATVSHSSTGVMDVCYTYSDVVSECAFFFLLLFF